MELKPDDIATIKRLIAIARDVIERYNRLGEQAAGVFREILEFRDVTEESFREFIRELDEIDDRIGRIEQLIIYDRASINPPAAQRLKDEIGNELDTKHLRKMLVTITNKLNGLREQAATYTTGSIPINLLLEINEAEAALEKVRGELNR